MFYFIFSLFTFDKCIRFRLWVYKKVDLSIAHSFALMMHSPWVFTELNFQSCFVGPRAVGSIERFVGWAWVVVVECKVLIYSYFVVQYFPSWIWILLNKFGFWLQKSLKLIMCNYSLLEIKWAETIWWKFKLDLLFTYIQGQLQIRKL